MLLEYFKIELDQNKNGLRTDLANGPPFGNSCNFKMNYQSINSYILYYDYSYYELQEICLREIAIELDPVKSFNYISLKIMFKE